MGLPIRELYATNVGDESNEIFLSAYKPLKKDDGYHRPPKTALGFDMWIPNVLDLKEEDGIVPVEVTTSEKETGIWLICANDYFGNELHIYTCKPIHKDEKDRYGNYKSFRDWDFPEEEDVDFGLHIYFEDLKDFVAGDGPIPVTLKRI